MVDAGGGEDAVKDVICGLSVGISASSFLMHVELTFVNQWIAPLDQVDLRDWLVAVVINDYVSIVHRLPELLASNECERRWGLPLAGYWT
jgi:hypothetical protein